MLPTVWNLLEQKYQVLAERYMDKKIPKPSHWGGYRVIPNYFEFWQVVNNTDIMISYDIHINYNKKFGYSEFSRL